MLPGHGRSYIVQLYQSVFDIVLSTMEESWENLISYLEETEEDNLFNQSNRMKYSSRNDPKEMLQQQVNPNIMAATTYNPPFVAVTSNFQTSHQYVPNILPNFMNSSTMNNGSALGVPFRRTQVNHGLKARIPHKKVRSSTETAHHIVAERRRRLKLTQNFIALSAMIPGLKKTDKYHILQEAIKYVNELQERVRELETENQKINAYSEALDKKLQLYTNNNGDYATTTNCEANSATGYYRSSFTEELPQVMTRVSEQNVLVDILCDKQNDIVPEILNLVSDLHLSISSTSVLQFGASTLKITIIAQMDDEYSMTSDDLGKRLRKELLKSHEYLQ